MSAGIVAGLFAGALWGLSFIAPLAAAPYTPFDLMLVRYLVFGLASLVLLARDRFHLLRALTLHDVRRLVALGLAGNVAYYAAMSFAVPRAGSAMVALVVGCVPVLLGVLGNRGPQRIAPRRFALPLLLVLSGLLLVNFTVLRDAQGDPLRALGGIGLALAALAVWCWYGLANARALAARPHLTDTQWTALTGAGTLLALLPVLPLGAASELSAIPALGLHGVAATRLLLWGTTLGLLCSLCATWAWSIASRRLPVTLAAQLIVTETLFALLYGALYEGQPPGPQVAAGALCLVAGVLLAIRRFAPRPQ
jgi:drug/metabolite transporter (DMT)-like permease